jgi:hypothetical protein
MQILYDNFVLSNLNTIDQIIDLFGAAEKHASVLAENMALNNSR